MSNESILELIRRLIADEENLSEPYHQGRVAAFRLVVDLMTEDPAPDRTSGHPWPTTKSR